MREIAFDTETTGLDPDSGHRIVELGCVEMMDKIRTGRNFQAYLNPGRNVPDEAQAVHGITTEFLKDKPLFSEVAAAFLEFVADSTLVIHNAGFDLKFINAELKRVGLPAFAPGIAVDTLTMARRKFPGAQASLDALCKRFNIDLSSRTKHGALLDAELLADVYLELCGGRQASILLVDAAAPGGTAQAVSAPAGECTIPTRSFPPSTEELAAHAKFLLHLKNPIWAKPESAE